jgi:hypothetical protein
MGDVAYGWIGATAVAPDPAEQAGRAPSLVVTAVHSALGAVHRLQVRVGAVTVLLTAGAAGWVQDTVVERLDVGAHLAAALDLTGRDGEAAPAGGWAGTLPVSRYAAFRTADPDHADELAGTAGCPAELVRALAEPVALGRVEVVRRDAAALATGPTLVVTDELAWVDGGTAGLWTVRPSGPDDVAIGSGRPAGVAAALAGMVRSAVGC